MKNLFKKLICTVLILSTSVTLFACDPETTPPDPNDIVDTYVDTVNKEEVSDSNVYFINSKTTSYHILLASNVDENRMSVQQKAASELNYFITNAGYNELPITYDNAITGVDFSKNYISIGDTTYYQAYVAQNNLTNDLDFLTLGNDGYKIRTNGNVVIINAYGNNGLLYGAYGFLERNMGYRYYAKDEWKITNSDNVKLKNMNVVAVPDFNSRFLDTATYNNESDYIIRLRNHGRGYTGVKGLEDTGWVGNDLSMCNQFLRPEEYYAKHPNWYSGDGSNKGGQLCFTTLLSNKEEDGKPLDEMFKNVLNNFIIPNPTARVVMFGINDNENRYCICDACVEEVSKIKHSGQICLVINAMQDKFNAWQASLPNDDPNKNRKITFAFFAYLYCMEAAVNYDESTDTYSFVEFDAPYTCLGGDGVNGDGVADDLNLEFKGNVNIAVRIAHLRVNNMFPQYNVEYNGTSQKAFETWGDIAPTLSVWDYATSFTDYIAPYPDWDVIKNNLVYYRMKGVKEILTQLPAHTSGTSFYAMMIFVRSELLWDVDKDIEELYKEFILNYYGPQAYDSIYAYLNYLRDYYAKFNEKHVDENGTERVGVKNGNEWVSYFGGIYEELTHRKFFPYEITMHLKSFFNTAESKLNAVKTTEPKYQKYLDRVQVESLFVRYMEIKNFYDRYTSDELAYLINEFERIANVGNLTQINNGGKNGATQIKDFIEKYRRYV